MFERKSVFLSQKHKLKKISFMTSSEHHKTPYDTHLKVVINRTKFEAGMPSSFKGVKANKQTNAQPELCLVV